MKANQEEVNKQAEQIMGHIWPLFDVLKSENVSSEHYSVVLFLLSVYKDGLLGAEKSLATGNLIEQLEVRLSPTTDKLASEYKPIFIVYKPTLSAISNGGLEKIVDTLTQLDIGFIKANFLDIFNGVLRGISRAQGKRSQWSLIPDEIIRLMLGFADLSETSKIYNPFAGLASFALYLSPGNEYFGQEINRLVWALGALRLLAYHGTYSETLVNDDSLMNWPAESRKYDLIISIPPFGLDIRSYGIKGNYIHTYAKAEHFVLEKALDNLSDSGKLITLVPTSLLHRTGGAEHIIANLVDKDLIDTIVSLPGGLLDFSSIPVSVVVLNKSKNHSGHIRLVQAKDYVRFNVNGELLLDEEQLSSLIKSQGEDKKTIRFVETREIQNNDYNLSVARYFQKQIDGVKLGDIIQRLSGHRNEIPDMGKLVRIRDLKDNKDDARLDLTSIKDVELGPQSIIKISESCILLAVRWKALKPTYFDYKEESIYLNRDILAFKINEEKVDVEYLINELNSNYVIDQLEAFRTGVYDSFLSTNDLTNVKIHLPSLQEQRAKVQGIKQVVLENKTLEIQKDIVRYNVAATEAENSASLSHTLGTPLSNINSFLNSIEAVLTRHYSNFGDIFLSEKRNITIKDSFDYIRKELKSIKIIVDYYDYKFDVSKYKLDELDIIEYINKYVQNTRLLLESNHSLELLLDPSFEESDKPLLVKSHEGLLDIIFNEFIENAKRHAFVDKEVNHKIQIRLSITEGLSITKYMNIDWFNTNRIANNSYRDWKEVYSSIINSLREMPYEMSRQLASYVKIEVANTGKPFLKNFGLEEFVRLHSKAGENGNTGQGGYQINEIIKYHNAGESTLQLQKGESISEFLTTFIFLLPII